MVLKMVKKTLVIISMLLFAGSIYSTASSINTKSENTLVKNRSYDYIIITSSSFKNYYGENSFHDLCNYHKQNGLSTKIETVESIKLKRD